jgi:hypothetical protein
MHTLFWLENLKERDYLEDLGINERIMGNRVGVGGLDSCDSG